MGLFNRGHKITVEQCCQEFYDSTILQAAIAGDDIWSGFLDTLMQSVVEADPSFSHVDPNLFRQEMTALRLEVIALAWSDKFENEKHTLPQSVFTKRYLERIGRLDLWDIMDDYNKVVGYSAGLSETGEPSPETGEPSLSRGLRLRSLSLLLSASSDEEKMFVDCMARVACRTGASMARADCIAAKVLAFRLAERLGYITSPRAQAVFRLAAAIFGFYRGAQEYLKPVRLQS
ncbi:MAG: hypothetical protein ABIH46_06640 [Chloroflexota bacterium]